MTHPSAEALPMPVEDAKDIRQVIVMASYLKMPLGKAVSQGAHASLGAFTKEGKIMTFEGERYFAFKLQNQEEEDWLQGKFKKVVLKATSEEELMAIHDKAVLAGLRMALILDSGLTVFKQPTLTGLAMGPADKSVFEPITGHLKSL